MATIREELQAALDSAKAELATLEAELQAKKPAIEAKIAELQWHLEAAKPWIEEELESLEAWVRSIWNKLRPAPAPTVEVPPVDAPKP